MPLHCIKIPTNSYIINSCLYLDPGSSDLVLLLLYIVNEQQFASSFYPYIRLHRSRLTVVSRKAKEDVPYNGLRLSTNACEYFTKTNLVKLKNAITDGPNTLAFYYSS